MNYADWTKELSGNGMMAFSDAAGSKSCLALAAILLSKDSKTNLRLISNQHHGFYTEWETPVELVQPTDDIPLEGVDWLFTGTSHPDSSRCFELQIIQKAQKKGIRTIAFIDHQTALIERFQFGNQSIVFPDIILLSKNVYLNDAVAAGLPEKQLVCIEDPYKTFLHSYWKSQLSAQDFRLGYAIPAEIQHVVTIAPDPISLRHDLDSFGFNELTFLESFLPLAKEEKFIFFLLKPHPLQPLNPLKELVKRYEANNIFLDEKGIFPNPEVTFHSSAIIGFVSNFLIEGNVMGKTIFRYLVPEKDKFDRIFRNFAIQCTSTDELMKELKAFLGTCKTV